MNEGCVSSLLSSRKPQQCILTAVFMQDPRVVTRSDVGRILLLLFFFAVTFSPLEPMNWKFVITSYRKKSNVTLLNTSCIVTGPHFYFFPLQHLIPRQPERRLRSLGSKRAVLMSFLKEIPKQTPEHECIRINTCAETEKGRRHSRCSGSQLPGYWGSGLWHHTAAVISVSASPPRLLTSANKPAVA